MCEDVATMFRIKICGITNLEDARLAVRAGADAIGLNFFAQSPRFITPEMAGEIIQVLPPAVVKVGVFVDAPAEEVCRLFDDLRLDLIQLHGREPPEYVAQLGGRPVMKAFCASPGTVPIFVPTKMGLSPSASPPASSLLDLMVAYIARCRELGAPLSSVLLDALVAGQHGGSGHTTDWRLARDYTARTDLPPLVLAGGLTPENVAEAIRTVHPAAVDVASGVELSPGRKASALLESFIQAAQLAFHGMNQSHEPV